MSKVIVTLRSAPPASVDITDDQCERSCFGALRFFPGIPKTITKAELEYLGKAQPMLRARLQVRPYVESKRLDYRGASEAKIEVLASEEGVGHLDLAKQIEVLRQRGKLDVPDKRKSTETRLENKALPPAAAPIPSASTTPKSVGRNGGKK